MATVLDVKNLKVSFRTTGGTLKAVRDISFSLERGKTLAIVGESGSGKSVTSRSILGILAGNAIVDGGEILYDGKDLLKIPEEEMCKIRGDRISMVFQDPLSSLNPIVKIGRQITEAMLLKNKGNRRRARKAFNKTLATLRKNMIAANPSDAAEITEMTKVFDNSAISALKMETAYTTAYAYADEIHETAGDLSFLLSKKQKVNMKLELKELTKKLRKLKNRFLTDGLDAELNALAGETAALRREYITVGKKKRDTLTPKATAILTKVAEFTGRLEAEEKPDFMSIGYYRIKHNEADLSGLKVSDINAKTTAVLNEEFMEKFLSYTEAGLLYSHNSALEKKKEVLAEMSNARSFYEGEYKKSAARSYGKKLASMIEASIDPLEVIKDSYAYTFRSSILHAIDQYFYFLKHNPKEEARFARQTKRREAMIARGKKVDWKVVPKRVLDTDELHDVVLKTVTTIDDRYQNYISENTNGDVKERSRSLVDWFRVQASEAVYRVSKSMAKEKAIKLMKEVGIPEPRIRFNQYPFEFSGGMRQRIVIAIALAADPDILICDEPTTALDVTIQAQILELINKLKAERKLSVIFITHDLGVVANMADDIAVMYAGKIVEYGTADDIFYNPRHPYTWALLSSMPDLDTKEKLDAIPGTPPNMIYPPEGDAFAARNKYAMQIDYEQEPPQFRISDTHWAATWLLHPDAPKVDIPKAISDRIERMRAKSETTA